MHVVYQTRDSIIILTSLDSYTEQQTGCNYSRYTYRNRSKLVAISHYTYRINKETAAISNMQKYRMNK